MTNQHSESNSDVKSRYEQYIMPIWKDLDIPIQRSEGCIVEDFDGNEYLDAFSGIAVTNVGHRNQAVTEAAKEQLDTFVHGCSYLHPNNPIADLGERIADIAPGDLDTSFFCNSDTEAVEGAIKLARKYTGSKEVIALEMSFHGRTLGSLALTGNKSYKKGMAPTINDVAHVSPPYAYRCQRCSGGPCTFECADSLERVISTHTSGDLAAVVVEPILGEGGIIVPPDGWLKRLQEITHDHGGLLIVDEVQTGYGRTGTMWGCDQFDVVPDIMPQAKGIANGLPLGAFTARRDIADAFEAGDHLSTFGGNPVACAAALETINQLQDGLIENAAAKGDWLGNKLTEVEDRFDVVGETRGVGLMHGVELVNPDTVDSQRAPPEPAPKLAKHVGKRVREEHGVIIGVGGFHNNVMRIQPPLPINQTQLERTVDALNEAIEAERGNRISS